MMPAVHAVHLGGLAYALGTLRPIAELPELAGNPTQLAYLQRTGLRDYARAEGPLSELVQKTCRRSLDEAGVPLAEIGAIVYASSSYVAERDRELLPRLALALGIPDAVPYGVFLANCANGCLALETASNLLALGKARAVLVITADAVAPGGVRALPDRTCVLSDGAASCVAATRPLGGYELEAIEPLHCPRLVEIDRRTAAGELAYIQAVAEGLTAVCRRLAARTGRAAVEHARLVTGNYNRSIIGNYAELCGMPPARLFADNLPRIAHCFASDQLIALTDLQAATAAGEPVLVLGSGITVWAAASLRRGGA
jgi:3-oxoacyl-[acyl-carrier-protein] synthase-3